MLLRSFFFVACLLAGITMQPQSWGVVAREGVEFILDSSRGLAGGIQQIKDRQGNTVQFAADGIRHSGGWSLRFERDAQRRITRITGPGGVQRRYSYDAAGNLAAAIEPDGTQAAYGYEDTKSNGSKVHMNLGILFLLLQSCI